MVLWSTTEGYIEMSGIPDAPMFYTIKISHGLGIGRHNRHRTWRWHKNELPKKKKGQIYKHIGDHWSALADKNFRSNLKGDTYENLCCTIPSNAAAASCHVTLSDPSQFLRHSNCTMAAPFTPIIFMYNIYNLSSEQVYRIKFSIL